MTLPRSSGWTRTSRARPRRRPRLSTRTSSGYSTMPLTRCSRASSSTSGLAARLASGGLGVGLLRLLGLLGRRLSLRRALGRSVALGGLGLLRRRLGLGVLGRRLSLGVLGRSLGLRVLGRRILGRSVRLRRRLGLGRRLSLRAVRLVRAVRLLSGLGLVRLAALGRRVRLRRRVRL